MLSILHTVLTRSASTLAVIFLLAFPLSAQAVVMTYSFDNVQGALAGSVSGTITLPEGDGFFAATKVTLDMGPTGLNYSLPLVLTDFDVIENYFTVSGGVIDKANSFFLSFINPDTAFALNLPSLSNASFVDVLNAADVGETGVRDNGSTTLNFGIANSSSIPLPATVSMLLLLLISIFRSRIDSAPSQ